MEKNRTPAGVLPVKTAVLMLILFVLLSSVSCVLPLKSLPEIPLKDTAAVSRIPDGTYFGEYKHIVRASVLVSVEKGVITRITLLKHSCSPIGKKGEAVVASILKRGDLKVDAVSGATVSSYVIIKAVENALGGIL